MGRIDTNEVQYHQGLQFEQVHQTLPETIDDAPPNEDDLYQPPSDYQPDRPPPPHAAEVHSFPPQNHDQPPQAFPPAYDSYPDKPQAFPPPPPPQEQTFSPIMGNQYHHQQQQQQPNVGMQMNYQGQVVGGVPVGASPSPLLQQQQYQPPTQPWKTQLFDCMDDPQNAVITLFFPCVTFGQIAEIMDSGNTPCGTSGMLYTLIACCIAMPCIMSCTYRSKMRSKFGLIESPAPDWLVHCFCECCALCQEYRELQERGFDPSIGWLGNVAKQQQKQQQFGMTPPMQQRMN